MSINNNNNNSNNKCLFCNTATRYIAKTQNTFVACSDCEIEHNLLPKSFCIDVLLIKAQELATVKYFHKSSQKLYIYSDIQNIINKLYGENYIHIKQQKLVDKYKKIHNLELLRNQRKEKLIAALSDYKLDYLHYGDCYTFVQFGYPTIDVVITNQIASQQYEPTVNNINNQDNTLIF